VDAHRAAARWFEDQRHSAEHLFLGGDKLQAVGRTKQSKVFQITSEDAGKTWGEISSPTCRIQTPARTPSRSRMDVICSSTTTPPRAAAR